MSKLVIGSKLGEIDLDKIDLSKIKSPYERKIDWDEINRRLAEEAEKYNIARFYRIGFPYVDEGHGKPIVDEGWGKPLVDEGFGKQLVDEDWNGSKIAKHNDWSKEYTDEELASLREKYGYQEEQVRQLIKRR